MTALPVTDPLSREEHQESRRTCECRRRQRPTMERRLKVQCLPTAFLLPLKKDFGMSCWQLADQCDFRARIIEDRGQFRKWHKVARCRSGSLRHVRYWLLYLEARVTSVGGFHPDNCR